VLAFLNSTESYMGICHFCTYALCYMRCILVISRCSKIAWKNSDVLLEMQAVIEVCIVYSKIKFCMVYIMRCRDVAGRSPL